MTSAACAESDQHVNATHPTPRRECLYDSGTRGCTRGGCPHHLKPCPFPSGAEKRARCTCWRDPADAREALGPTMRSAPARSQPATPPFAVPSPAPPAVETGPERHFCMTPLPAGFGDQRSQTRYELICPFCAATVIAYRWSLAGSGKRCSCGVLLCTGVALDTHGIHGPAWSTSKALGKARE